MAPLPVLARAKEDAMPGKTKQPVLDEDNPEWTKTDFAVATKFPPGVRLKDLRPSELARAVENRRRQKAPTKGG
jgi:hypothetical protein